MTFNCDCGKNIQIGGDITGNHNSTILPGVIIGDWAVIGTGSVVTEDIPADSVAVGVLG